MRIAHTVMVSVFCKPHEDNGQIVGALRGLFPFPLKKQLRQVNATAHDESRIIIYEIILTKEGEINQFLQHLAASLGTEQRELILRQLDTRLDDELYFFLRLDKERLLQGEYAITDGGNCYHIKVLLASYPKNRENAKAIVQILFS